MTLNSELDELKGSLKMCHDDQAELTVLEKDTYNYRDLGIYSPLMEGLESERALYNYKNNKVESFSYTLDREEGRPVRITIFKLIESFKLPALDERFLELNNPHNISSGYDFPVFYAYEFATFVVPESYVSARIPETSPSTNRYVNKNNIQMYKGLEGGPKCTSGVTLRSHAFTEWGKQIFMILSKERESQFEPCFADETTQEIRSLNEDLENVADTLQLSRAE
jgi:hypothetical protein